jgi:hypothetical protein
MGYPLKMLYLKSFGTKIERFPFPFFYAIPAAKKLGGGWDLIEV